MKQTDEEFERICNTFSNIEDNQLDAVEEFFLQSLLKDNHLGSIRFDDITKNMEKHRDQIQE